MTNSTKERLLITFIVVTTVIWLLWGGMMLLG